jgi:membrane-bound ClpP family serine protease
MLCLLGAGIFYLATAFYRGEFDLEALQQRQARTCQPRPTRYQTIHSPERETPVVRGLVGLLIVVAIVLFLLKVALVGGIVGTIALILLVLLLLGRL